MIGRIPDIRGCAARIVKGRQSGLSLHNTSAVKSPMAHHGIRSG